MSAKRPQVALVDYGLGNILSVRRALEKVGGSVEVLNDPEKILKAKKIVLPGVGSFSDASHRLNRTGISEALLTAVESGSSVLGICLGMQILLSRGFEFGLHPGLNIIEGDVDPIPRISQAGQQRLRVPRVGWFPLKIPEEFGSKCRLPLFKNISAESEFYFVHSFSVKAKYKNNVVCVSSYGGHDLTAVIQERNVIGVQFHPEKSGACGLDLLKNFLKYF